MPHAERTHEDNGEPAACLSPSNRPRAGEDAPTSYLERIPQWGGA